MPNPVAPHILIIGAGAIGGFYGAILKRAGCAVSAVARSQYDAIHAHGFRVESPLGDLSWQPEHLYRAGDLPPTPPDYLILATKVTPDSDRAGLIRPWLGEHTQPVLIQNGLDIEREIADALPGRVLISCLAFAAASRVGPGRFKHTAGGHLVMGDFPSGIEDGSVDLAARFRTGGVTVKLTGEILRERWIKCVWNTSLNPLSVLANGADTQTILTTDGGEALVRTLMREVIAAARADGHELPGQKLIDRFIRGTRNMPPHQTSMALDYINHRPIELDAILGNVVANAHRHGLDVPHLEMMLATLRMRTGSAAPNVQGGASQRGGSAG